MSTGQNTVYSRSMRPANAQQKVEGEETAKKCKHSTYACGYDVLKGYNYCMKHILEDKTALYKQCQFIFEKSGKRCVNAGAKIDKKDTLCNKHRKFNLILRQRSLGRQKLIPSPETLLWSLDHLDASGDISTTGVEKGGGDSLGIAIANQGKSLEDIEAFRNPSVVLNKHLKYAVDISDLDSEIEHLDAERLKFGDPNSGGESDSEDYLKHAGVYTSEEVARITRDKMLELRSLYLNQFDRLKFLLKCSKQKYLHSSKTEKETDTFSDLTNEYSTDWLRLKHLYGYHRRSLEARMFRKKQLEKKLKKSRDLGHSMRLPSHPKCVYSGGGSSRCGARCIPLSKYCPQHILHDPQQTLFKACGNADPDIICNNPTVQIYPIDRCLLHQTFPSVASTEKKGEVKISKLEEKLCTPEQLPGPSRVQLGEQGGGDNLSTTCNTKPNPHRTAKRSLSRHKRVT